MRAIVYNKYGTTDELHLKEIPKPVPTDDELLVKVFAASVNSWDCDQVKGVPYLTRIEAPLKPKNPILGCDIAGVVSEVGKNVKDFKVGDEVFGDISGGNWGGFAEYVCVKENEITIKPKEMSFKDAASIPQAAVLALQALRDKGEIKSGMKLLINGAGGGVGTFGLQIAKLYDVDVTCVDKKEKLDRLNLLGADHTIDYTKSNFTLTGETYDLIIDNVTNQPLRNYLRALKPNGRFIVVGGRTATILKIVLFGKLLSKIYGKHLRLLIHKPKRADLDYLSELYLNNKLKPIIGDEYKLEETPLAISKLTKGDVFGKAVILVQ